MSGKRRCPRCGAIAERCDRVPGYQCRSCAAVFRPRELPHQTTMLAPPVTREDPPTSDDRCTPPHVLHAVGLFWPQGIGLDPCWNPWSLVQARSTFTRAQDSLRFDWSKIDGVRERGTIWMNPPYSDPLPFCDRLRCALDGAWPIEALALVKHDPTTKWWAILRPFARAYVHVDTRLHFRLAGEDTGAADHTSTVIVLDGIGPVRDRAQRRRLRAFQPLGEVVIPC